MLQSKLISYLNKVVYLYSGSTYIQLQFLSLSIVSVFPSKFSVHVKMNVTNINAILLRNILNIDNNLNMWLISGDKESIDAIRTCLDELEDLPKLTLKYLIKHLTTVTRHQDENLMNSSNLSICWGACIFASSANAFESFESGNIIRKNRFVQILIEHYHQIFEPQTDQRVWVWVSVTSE